MEEKALLVVMGPTACGKTARAAALAQKIGGEIISADSRQVYRGMDIGTGKDIEEYGSVPYHMIDIVPAGHKYNLYQYLRDSRESEADIRARGSWPILCGGTGMYVEAVINDLVLPEVPVNAELRTALKNKTLEELTQQLSTMKQLHNTTDVDTVQRAIRAIEIEEYYLQHPDIAVQAKPHKRDDVVLLGIDISREKRRSRITQRLKKRLDEGMLDECRRLLNSGISPEDLIYYGLEYKYLTLCLIGELKYDEMVEKLEIAIHQFAKRQMTWFRGMERRGFNIRWIPYELSPEEFVDTVVRDYRLCQ